MMGKKDTCDVYSFNQNKVAHIKADIQKEGLSSVAQLFKALADENRVKIAYALCQNEELCVCDIANSIGSSVATASHHLRTLYRQEIVKHRKEGKLALYSLDDEHIKQIITIALTHTKEVK